ncbi:MAG: hypothetical protein H6Q53_2297 [Deltaproteobacteria bacterium]|jgi:hypothetical protein|nr:hypothetical protein [Deltaproteobacteria bacterium]
MMKDEGRPSLLRRDSDERSNSSFVLMSPLVRWTNDRPSDLPAELGLRQAGAVVHRSRGLAW